MVELHSKRLMMRQNQPGDVDPMHAIASDFDVVKNLASWPWPPDRAFTERRCGGARDTAEGFVGAVCKNGVIIGGMGIHSGGMGYMFARDHWGKGYATEMGRILIDHCMITYDWDNIKADVMQDNPASARVLEKLGFENQGECMCECAARGADVPAFDYLLTRSRWHALRTAAG